MDKKLVTCGLFLDFSKAFDPINHDILLSKLYSYGIRGNPLRWFESYLYNRNQVVKIGDTISSSQTIICGIPQGSTLGPLSFLLNINDLPNCSSKLSFRIFADDTNMFYTSNNLRNLESVMNEELKLVVKYCATNKLSINLSKTNYILPYLFSYKPISTISRDPKLLTQKINLINTNRKCIILGYKPRAIFGLEVYHRP